MLRKPPRWVSEKLPYVSQKVKGLGRIIHPLIASTLRDVFRKVDLVLNRYLDVEELNTFGAVSGLQYLKNISEEDFGPNGAMRYYSSSEEGLTCNGFVELLSDPEEIPEADLMNALRRLGYDDDLYSLKSRCYVASIHSVYPIKVNIGDNLTSTFKATARNLANDYELQKNGPGDLTIEDPQYTLFVN